MKAFCVDLALPTFALLDVRGPGLAPAGDTCMEVGHVPSENLEHQGLPWEGAASLAGPAAQWHESRVTGDP